MDTTTQAKAPALRTVAKLEEKRRISFVLERVS